MTYTTTGPKVPKRTYEGQETVTRPETPRGATPSDPSEWGESRTSSTNLDSSWKVDVGEFNGWVFLVDTRTESLGSQERKETEEKEQSSNQTSDLTYYL